MTTGSRDRANVSLIIIIIIIDSSYDEIKSKSSGKGVVSEDESDLDKCRNVMSDEQTVRCFTVQKKKLRGLTSGKILVSRAATKLGGPVFFSFFFLSSH